MKRVLDWFGKKRERERLRENAAAPRSEKKKSIRIIRVALGMIFCLNYERQRHGRVTKRNIISIMLANENIYIHIYV